MKTVLLLLALVAFHSQAQDGLKSISGNSFSVLIPQGTLANTYDHGFVVYGNYDYALNKFIALRFDLGWNNLSGQEITYVDPAGNIQTNHPNMSIWEFTGGVKTNFSIFYIEARGGYFTGINEWGIVPAVGVRLNHRIDIQGNYSFVGNSEWASVRIGYYWGE